MLNCLVNKLPSQRRKMASTPYLPRRASSVSGYYHSRRKSTKLGTKISLGDDDNGSMDDTSRRMSGELISMKDFLTANKVALAVMQKQLYETAQQIQSTPMASAPIHQPLFKPNAVGPLAIATEKFEGKINANR